MPDLVTRAVLFDLDDTLTDRAESVRSYARQLMADFGDRLAIADLAELGAVLIRVDDNGYNRARASDLAAHAVWRSKPQAHELAGHWREHFAEHTRARDGLANVVERLAAAGLRLGVITNGPTDKQRRKIEVLGLRERLGTLVISEEIGFAKPDERIFRAAASQLGVEPSVCVFIGDNPAKDVRGAAAVGMRAVWFRATLPWPDHLPVASESVRDLAEVPRLLGLELKISH